MVRFSLFISILLSVLSAFSQTPNFSYSQSPTAKRIQLYWQKDGVLFDTVRVKDQKSFKMFLVMMRHMSENKSDSVAHLYSLVKFNELHGNPKVRWLSEMPKWEKKLAGIDRACFVFHENTMYLDTTNLRWSGVHTFWGSKFAGMWFTELSHAEQLRIHGRCLVVKELLGTGIQFARVGFSPVRYRTTYDETEYSNKKSTEYQAHEIIEPYLYRQFQSQLFGWQILF